MTALYKKIYEDIKTKIEEEELKPGDQIDSESKLRMKYDCSRDTVRKATAMLEHGKYIEKSRGKQPVVRMRTKYTFPTSKIETFKELNLRSNLRAKTEVISIVENYNGKNLPEEFGEDCIEVKRVRTLDSERIVFDIDYLNKKLVSGITKKIAKNSIYEFIEINLGLKIAYSKKIVTVEKPTIEDKKHLDLVDGDLLVIVASSTFTEDGELLNKTISKHRYDKFVFESIATR